jgi:hypothetical protein
MAARKGPDHESAQQSLSTVNKPFGHKPFGQQFGPAPRYPPSTLKNLERPQPSPQHCRGRKFKLGCAPQWEGLVVNMGFPRGLNEANVLSIFLIITEE